MKPPSLCKQFCVRHVRPKDPTGNDHLKSFPKPAVKEGVNQWVDSGIKVPQPHKCVEQSRRYRVADEGVDYGTEERRQPDGQKHTHDDGQRFGGFSLVFVHLGGAGVL